MKAPNDQIKETCIRMTKGIVSKEGIDNPEKLSSRFRKEVTVQAMVDYAKYYHDQPCDLKYFYRHKLSSMNIKPKSIGY